MSTNDDKLQYEKIKRIIQSSPCMVKQHSNSKLSYERVKRMIETSPLETKSMDNLKDSQIDTARKNLDALKSFYIGQKKIKQTKSSNGFESRKVDELEPTNSKPSQNNLTSSIRDSKAGKAQIFVGGSPQKPNTKRNGNILPVAKGKSWITVKID